MTKEKKPVNPRTRMGGNKEIPIDWKEVERLAICGCSGRQVAEAMGINYDTLYKRCKKDQKMMWGEYSSRKKAKGDALLYSRQFQMALEKDRGMLIWLGKNRLGQRDNPEQKEVFNGELAQVLDYLKNANLSFQVKAAGTDIDRNVVDIESKRIEDEQG